MFSGMSFLLCNLISPSTLIKFVFLNDFVASWAITPVNGISKYDIPLLSISNCSLISLVYKCFFTAIELSLFSIKSKYEALVILLSMTKILALSPFERSANSNIILLK